MKTESQLAVLIMLFSAVSCTTAKPRIKTPQDVREEVISKSPKEEPKWYSNPPKSDDKHHYFVGHSERAFTEVAAMNEAMDHATKRFVDFCGGHTSISSASSKETIGKTSEVLSGTIHSIQKEKKIVEAFVARVKAKEWYLRKLRIFRGETPVEDAWKASVLIQVPVEVAAEIIKKNNEKLFKIQTEAEKEKAPFRNAHQDPMDIGGTGAKKVKPYYDPNLEWLAGPAKNTTWNEARSWVEGLGDGWRMPTMEELRSLHKEDKEGNRCRNLPEPLETTGGWWVWSSKPDKDSPGRYLGFIFGVGCKASIQHSHSHSGRAFAVRGKLFMNTGSPIDHENSRYQKDGGWSPFSW